MLDQKRQMYTFLLGHFQGQAVKAKTFRFRKVLYAHTNSKNMLDMKEVITNKQKKASIDVKHSNLQMQ